MPRERNHGGQNSDFEDFLRIISQNPYNIINSTFNRKDAINAAKYAIEISKYVLEQKYDNLVFVDISARGIAPIVSHALYLLQKKEGKAVIIPKMMFLDPNGVDKSYYKSSSEVRNSYKGADREGKTLIIDTCSHTGEALDKVISALAIGGFNEDKIDSLIIGGERMKRKAKDIVTKIIDPKLGFCYPFGRRTDRQHISSIHSENIEIYSSELRDSLAVNKQILREMKSILS